MLAGLAIAFVVSRSMQNLLHGVSPTDPLTFGVVAAALTMVATVASLVPAWRAMRVDPVVALKTE
jgi:putative ABC transport system permease protein